MKQFSVRPEEATEYLLWLTENSKLIKAGDIYYSAKAIREAETLLRVLYLKRVFTIGQARDALGTSRKYAQYILEYLDARQITIREGDTRHFLT